jgi:adenylate kinase family enzyme
MLQKPLTYIWRGFVVLLFISGLSLITLWVLREYDFPFFVEHIPTAAFEPLITLFLYLTGFSGVGSAVALIAKRRSIGEDSATEITIHPRQRKQLINALMIRYRERLGTALDQQARIALTVQMTPDAVAPVGRDPRAASQAEREMSSRDAILDVFNDAGGQLLIMGAPGAGKTTLLLELANVLLEEADQNELLPIPVLVPLSTWSTKAEPLDVWLQDALYPATGVNSAFAERLVAGRHLLLLLDGLDEMPANRQAACIAAINDYCKNSALSPQMVVCCRKEEYEATGSRLILSQAVTIKPLETSQVIATMEQQGEATAGLQAALATDQYLRDLLRVPLMVDIAVRAYADQTVDRVTAMSKQQRQDLLLGAYVTRMFQRYVGERAYSPEQTRRWLRWLAQNMQRDFLSEFLLERLPPTWLPNRRLYTVIITLLVGPIWGSVIWGYIGFMVAVPVGYVIRYFFGNDVGWLVGGIVALLAALVGGMSIGRDTANKDTVSPVYSLRWSWSEMIWPVFFGLVFVASVGLLMGLSFGLVWGLVGLMVGPLLLMLGLMSLESAGQPVAIEQLHIPNQGIRRSLVVGLGVGLGVGLSGLLVGLLVGLALFGSFGLLVGLVFGLMFGLWVGLDKGGEAVVQHYVLRFVLWRQGVVPRNYVRFLNYACGLLFLQRDGAIYRFRHPLLQDYFARLKEDKPGARGKEL